MTIPSLKNQVKTKGASLPYFSFKVLMDIMENRSFRKNMEISYHVPGRLSRTARIFPPQGLKKEQNYGIISYNGS